MNAVHGKGDMPLIVEPPNAPTWARLVSDLCHRRQVLLYASPQEWGYSYDRRGPGH